MNHRQTNRRQTGSLLVEVVIALTLLTAGILGFFTALTSSIKAGEDVGDKDHLRAVSSYLVEYFRSTDFNSLYSWYNNTTFEMPNLEGDQNYYYYYYPYYENAARATVTFYVNELAIPAEFGPILDIDGSGGLNNSDCSTSYKLLPTRITLTYKAPHGMVTRDLYVILGQK